jgi:ribA/ribD-fused uncharacterized protein
MSVSTDQLRRFYKSRAKNSDLFTYDNNGNLIELDKNGGVKSTLPLPTYRAPTYEEFNEMEQKRKGTIIKAEQDYENARTELRRANESLLPTSEVLRLNKKVEELDIILQSVRFPLRYVKTMDSVAVRDVLFDDIYETRKMPNELALLLTRPYTLQDSYVRVGQAPTIQTIRSQPIPVVASITPIILFSEPETNEYDFLGLNWPVEMEFNSTQYNSAKQAIMAEIAKFFNDEENLERIMIYESPEEIEYSYLDVPGESDVNEGKWDNKMKELILDVNLQKFRQFAELGQKLLETRNASLGYYQPDDTILGIGIPLEDPNAKDKTKWTGQNILGKSLEQIRNIVRDDKNKTAQLQQQTQLQQVKRRKPQIGILSQ